MKLPPLPEPDDTDGHTYAGHSDDQMRERDRQIVELCAQIVSPKRQRPCDCTVCYCGNVDDARDVAEWDEGTADAKAIRSLLEEPK